MIEIKNIEKTRLNKKALLKIIKKYSNSKKDILLVFDGRLGIFGYYKYNSKKHRHEIKISTRTHQFKDRMSRVYEMIGTVLHELKHLQQHESVGSVAFMGDKLSRNERIKSMEGADYFSVRECEARTFEEKNVLPATDFYWKCLKKLVR